MAPRGTSKAAGSTCYYCPLTEGALQQVRKETHAQMTARQNDSTLALLLLSASPARRKGRRPFRGFLTRYAQQHQECHKPVTAGGLTDLI